MNTCETCKYFSLKVNDYGVTWTECTSPKLLENGHSNKDVEDDTLEYSYDEGGYFSPGKNFGCIHWLRKGE